MYLGGQRGKEMGLDIIAYSKLEKSDCSYSADGEPVDPQTGKTLDDDTFVQVRLNPHFPGRADDLEDEACYSYDLTAYFYEGTYSGYNRWRDQLAELAGYPLGEADDATGNKRSTYCAACWNGETGPFSELIHFSDSEGALGAEICKKLAADFAHFQVKADTHQDVAFRSTYADFREGFELAADGGCVCFC